MTLAGEKVSVESIEKANKTRLASLTSRYEWELAEPHLDVEIKNGSARRFNKYITMREFKENILSGMSIKDMSSSGISPKVIQFFSNFCQGKIKLTKQEFEECYHSGVSLDEISKKYKVTREDVTSLRQLYGIKRKGATYMHRKNTEEALTQRQKDILYGSMMGDAYRMASSSAGFKQCLAQKEYLMWKYNELKNVSHEKSLKYFESNDERAAYKNSKGYWRFYTKANTDIEECNKMFYNGGSKEITKEILDNLSELSLAVWMMDDGTTGFSHKARVRTGHNITPEVKLCTDSFSEKSCDNIVEWFKDKWNIDSHKRRVRIGSNGKAQYRIVLKSTSVSHFFSLITPHIVPTLQYKVSYSAYKKVLASEST